MSTCAWTCGGRGLPDKRGNRAYCTQLPGAVTPPRRNVVTSCGRRRPRAPSARLFRGCHATGPDGKRTAHLVEAGLWRVLPRRTTQHRAGGRRRSAPGRPRELASRADSCRGLHPGRGERGLGSLEPRSQQIGRV